MAMFASEQQTTDWDELLIASPSSSHFFQMIEFARIKQSAGWMPRYIMTSATVPVLALQKPIPGLGKLWYIPQGPGATEDTLQDVMMELKALALENGVFGIKFEPQLPKTENLSGQLNKFATPSASAQPTHSTIWLDIRPDISDINASFDAKARYNIRQAQKAGVECRVMSATEDTYRAFYDLFQQTGDGRFIIRPYGYYQRFWDTYCQAGRGFIMFAYSGDQLLATDFVIVHGTLASRKDAGSSRQKNIRGVPALLVLETIKELKTRGVTDYDLCGAPESASLKDQTHPLYGVGQFKAGFSKIVTDYAGTYFMPVKPIRATLWKLTTERIIRYAYYKKHQQSWY